MDVTGHKSSYLDLFSELNQKIRAAIASRKAATTAQESLLTFVNKNKLEGLFSTIVKNLPEDEQAIANSSLDLLDELQKKAFFEQLFEESSLENSTRELDSQLNQSIHPAGVSQGIPSEIPSLDQLVQKSSNVDRRSTKNVSSAKTPIGSQSNSNSVEDLQRVVSNRKSPEAGISVSSTTSKTSNRKRRRLESPNPTSGSKDKVPRNRQMSEIQSNYVFAGVSEGKTNWF